jgi:hypothetical protein
MLGFHIDMNIAQYKKGYLEKWLNELASLGYDTIFWELEDNVKWQTCPECASPEAFTKYEFKDLLKLCKNLGLESVPVLQTLGHCEYVIRNEKYKHLAELPDKNEQYCPLHPQLAGFIKQWLDEYIDLFGVVKKFHIGADEAFHLGKCPKCRDFAEKHSLSELYVQYVEQIAGHLIKKDIQPIIWADMALKYPEAINKLSRKIMFADWRYNIYRGSGKVWVWSKGQLCTAEQLDSETLKVYGKFLFPDGNEPGREPETFYTSDFLKSYGFETLLCSSSSSYGDNIFAPRTYFHFKNIYDMAKKGMQEGFAGTVLTSWTVRLVPWELQKPCIELAPFAARNSSASIEDFQKSFLEKHFGTADSSFFKACGLLSKTGLFMCALTLGFYKDVSEPVPADQIEKTIEKLFNEKKLQGELESNLKLLEEYEQSLEILNKFKASAKKGYEEITIWQLAARNLINRARASVYLLKGKDADKRAITSVLDELRKLKDETRMFYEPIIKPVRLNLIIHWMYDSIENALLKL